MADLKMVLSLDVDSALVEPFGDLARAVKEHRENVWGEGEVGHDEDERLYATADRCIEDALKNCKHLHTTEIDEDA